MRYSIIHHDVRREFDLTIAEYLVCESVHQLSHQAPCRKSNRELGEFIGFGDWSVGNAKKALLTKGLITITEDGCKTTEKWLKAVTFARSVKITDDRENHGKTRENHGRTYINNINKKGNSSEFHSLSEKEKTAVVDEIKEVPIDSDGDPKVFKPRVLTPENDEIRRQFEAMCKRELSIIPAGVHGLGSKMRVAEALKHLTLAQCKDKIEEWFTRSMPDDRLLSITACFSNHEINKYRAEYGK